MPEYGVFPQFIYQRLKLDQYRNFFIVPIAYGFGYFLRRAIFKWAYDTQALGDIGSVPAGPELGFEFFCNGENRTRQVQPIPGKLIASPNNSQVILTLAPSPVDNQGYGFNMSASSPKNVKYLSVYFMYGDFIRIDVTGQDKINPGYCDILLDGYYVMEKSLALNAQG